MGVIDLSDRFAARRSESEVNRSHRQRFDLRAVAITRLAHQLARNGHPITEVAHDLRHWGVRLLEGGSGRP